MPEEKKESFTFSDKIKNSKPAGSKSVAKSSSKIGRDGKPRQTLFERTRRDAPFFIAALVALLLLPFLYKYSGQSSEDTTLLTPGSEETMFDSERYAFDSSALMEDPDGQIAQLSGRSSLDLIKGWGNKEEDYGDRDDMDFDSSAQASAEGSYEGSYEGEAEYNARRAASTNIDEEENITNIYKRRARKATRAAFRRTQIGKLDPASMRRGSGSRLGINPWGGSLKNAAKKVGDDGQRKPTKPVSLQPLRAAGPARSSFGHGAAAAARKGLDNMGKSDAKEALRDSYVKPVGPTRTGGIDLFSDGRTGGSGKLDHNINIGKGQTPWWWDMMKTRMQKEWEARFNRKWDWIKFADKLAQNILKGLINCLITGNSDGDPDNFLGSASIGGSGGGKKECCGLNEKKWGASGDLGMKGLPFDEAHCKANKGAVASAAGKTIEQCSSIGWWKDTTHAGGASVGFFRQRLCCLGLCGNLHLSGELGLHAAGGMECVDPWHGYHIAASGSARNWHKYTYVVARNYFPASLKVKGKCKKEDKQGHIAAKGNLLCSRASLKSGGTGLNFGDYSAAMGRVEVKNHLVNLHNASAKYVPSSKLEVHEKTLELLDPEDENDACVIYHKEGLAFNKQDFESSMREQVKEWCPGLSDEDAIKAVRELDVLYVASWASKHNFAAGRGSSVHKLYKMLPMLQWEYYEAYMMHRGVTNRTDGKNNNVAKKKERIENQDVVYGVPCYFGNANFACGKNDSLTADLIVRGNFQGGNARAEANNFRVTAQFIDVNGNKGIEEPMFKPEVQSVDDEVTGGMTHLHYNVAVIRSTQAFTEVNKISPNAPQSAQQDGLVGTVRWTAYRGDQLVAQEDCGYNTYGDVPGPITPIKTCLNMEQSKKCCEELMGEKGYHWDASRPEGSRCVPPLPTSPLDEDKNRQPILGNVPEFQGGGNLTRLAPILSWIPGNGKTDCRETVGDDVNIPAKSVFEKCEKVPEIDENRRDHCAEERPMLMDSQAAADFVRAVVAAYNKSLPAGQKPLSDKFSSGAYPTDGEFVDALFLANNNKGLAEMPQEVRASAVCELGRDFVRKSRDPQVGNRRLDEFSLSGNLPQSPYGYGQTGSQDKSTWFYTNDLGAFLTYVHPEAIFYPGVWVAENTICDQRFIGVRAQTGAGQKCYNTLVPKKMHYNNYHSMLNKPGGAPNSAAKNSIWDSKYKKSLVPSSLATRQPLHGLVDGKQWTGTEDYHALYNKCGIDGYKSRCITANGEYKKDIEPLLTEKSGFTPWKGEACKAFYAGSDGANIQVADVLEYVQTVCAAGLDNKPHGIGDAGDASGQGAHKPSQGGGAGSVGVGSSGNARNPRE